MSKKPFKLGSDPELIILDAENTPISAEGIVGFGKEAPMILEGGFGIHEDNILIEFNIPPASNSVAFLRNNIKAIYLIYKMFLKEKGLKVSRDCYANYDAKYLETDQAQAVGCSPEFDAASCTILQPPVFIGELGRCAGGHIHIGYDNENEADSMMIIKMLDLHLGIPSLIIDLDTQRRRLYGKASSYRRNPGVKVEYRTLSNFWLFDKRTIEWVYSTTAKVVNEVLSGAIIDDELYSKVREIINSNDRKGAQLLLNENSSISLPSTDSLDIMDMIYKDDNFLVEFIRDIDSDILIEEIEGQSIFEKNESNMASPNTRIKREKSMDDIPGMRPGILSSNAEATWNSIKQRKPSSISFDLGSNYALYTPGSLRNPGSLGNKTPAGDPNIQEDFTPVAFWADDELYREIIQIDDGLYSFRGHTYAAIPERDDTFVHSDSDIFDNGEALVYEDGAQVYVYTPDELRRIYNRKAQMEEALPNRIDEHTRPLTTEEMLGFRDLEDGLTQRIVDIQNQKGPTGTEQVLEMLDDLYKQELMEEKIEDGEFHATDKEFYDWMKIEELQEGK